MTNHIMFSYQWNSGDLVEKIFNYLTKNQSIPVWMDKHGGITEYLSQSMADGVENCCVLVCFLTAEYQESINCKKELTYASTLNKAIIPCLVGSNDETKKWKPSQWLAITITDLIYLNFTNINELNFQSKCEELILRISSILGKKITLKEIESKLIPDEKEESDEEDFQIERALIIPANIRQGPEINNQTESILPKKYPCEGDSSIRLINQSTEIEVNQDFFARNGRFFNSFTFPRFIFHNRSSEDLSIIQLSSEYKDKTNQWISCEINVNKSDDIINIEPNKLLNYSLTIQIELNGKPGIDNEHRFRAHHLLPQPLQMKISIEDTQMKYSNIIIEQINKPLNLPTLNKLIEKFKVSESNLIDFIWCDDCSIDIRYFLFIYYENNEENLFNFSFGSDLSSTQTPKWTKSYIQTLQKTARKLNQRELIVHEGILDSIFNSKALFDEQFKLQAIQIQIKTNTSFTEQTIRLPIQQIFTENYFF